MCDHQILTGYLEGLDFADKSKSYFTDGLRFMKTNTSQYLQVGENKELVIVVFVAKNIYREKAVEGSHETEGKSSDFQDRDCLFCYGLGQ